MPPHPPPFILEPHRVGTDGPWWVDCALLLHDSTRGNIVHSTAFYPTMGEALEAARRWLAWRRKTTVVLQSA